MLEEWRRLGWVKVTWEWEGTCWVSLGRLGGAEGKRKSWGSGGDPFGWEENVLEEWMKCWEI